MKGLSLLSWGRSLSNSSLPFLVDTVETVSSNCSSLLSREKGFSLETSEFSWFSISSAFTSFVLSANLLLLLLRNDKNVFFIHGHFLNARVTNNNATTDIATSICSFEILFSFRTPKSYSICLRCIFLSLYVDVLFFWYCIFIWLYFPAESSFPIFSYSLARCPLAKRMKTSLGLANSRL